MEFYEQAVMQYVTNGGQRFIAPQYPIYYGVRKKGVTGYDRKPDFVAIDLKERAIYFIEVGAGERVRDKAERLADNIQTDCKYLRKNLCKANRDLSEWKTPSARLWPEGVFPLNAGQPLQSLL